MQRGGHQRCERERGTSSRSRPCSNPTCRTRSQADDRKWEPPMKLTQVERQIVLSDEATLLLGRSGTGESR